MKFNDALKTCVQYTLNSSNQVPMLLGEPGIGKSSWVESLAHDMHTKTFVLACNQLADRADLTGLRQKEVTDPNTGDSRFRQTFCLHETVDEAIDYALAHPRETPILFMDELNRTTPDITSELLSLPTQRKLGNRCLPDNLKIIAAGNDKGNVTPLDTASNTRFVQIHVAPDLDTFFAVNPDLNPFVKTVLTKNPDTLLCTAIRVVTDNSNDDDDDDDDNVSIDEILDDDEMMPQMTTPRTITGLSKWLNGFKNADLMLLLQNVNLVNNEQVSVLQEYMEGFTGKTKFTTLLLGEIAANIMTTNNQTNNIGAPKPACYDQLKACSDMQVLDDFINNLSENDKSGCLVYALFEKEDNTAYINALTNKMTRFTPADTKTVMGLFSADLLDEGNLTVFTKNPTPFAQNMAVIMG